MIVLTFAFFLSIAVRAKKGKKKTLCGAAAGKVCASNAEN